MTDIYTQHAAAFRAVSAFVILNGAGDDWTRAVEKAGFRVLQAV